MKLSENYYIRHEVFIFTKFYEDWANIVDFLLMANYLAFPIFMEMAINYEIESRIQNWTSKFLICSSFFRPFIEMRFIIHLLGT